MPYVEGPGDEFIGRYPMLRDMIYIAREWHLAYSGYCKYAIVRVILWLVEQRVERCTSL